ncbi:MAG: hypothetical protein HOI23_10585 [Deltaproteobacteria bacterium]|nr:hypothetical protein [Deltaproteobacteria bacterium]MBT6434776.1 hypothetical protein [Deltaproteobacteria bacterium]
MPLGDFGAPAVWRWLGDSSLDRGWYGIVGGPDLKISETPGLNGQPRVLPLPLETGAEGLKAGTDWMAGFADEHPTQSKHGQGGFDSFSTVLLWERAVWVAL